MEEQRMRLGRLAHQSRPLHGVMALARLLRRPVGPWRCKVREQVVSEEQKLSTTSAACHILAITAEGGPDCGLILGRC